MPLQRQLIETPLSTGLSQKDDARTLVTSGAVAMQNLVRQKNGAVEKRAGHTALAKTQYAGGGATSLNSSAATIGSYKGALWGVLGGTLGPGNPRVRWVYSDATSIWTPLGFLPEGKALDRVIMAESPFNYTDYDMVVANGYLIAVMLGKDNTNTPRLYWTVLDVSGPNPTYAVVQAIGSFNIGQPATPLAPKLAVCGTTVVLTVISAGTVNCQTLSTTSIQSPWSAHGALTLGNAAAASLGLGVYDLSAVSGDATRFAIAYESTVAAQAATLCIYSASTFALLTTKGWDAVASFSTFGSVCLFAQNNDRYWVGYVPKNAASPVVRANFWNENGNTIGTAATIYTFLVAAGDPVGKCGMCPTGTAGQIGFIFSTGYSSGPTAMSNALTQYAILKDSAGTVIIAGTGNLNATGNVQLHGKPVLVTANTGYGPFTTAYAIVHAPSALQGTFYIVALELFSGTMINVSSLRAVASIATRLAKNIAAPMQLSANMVASTPQLLPGVGSGLTYAFPCSFSQQAFHTTIAIVPVDLNPTGIHEMRELGDLGLSTAGVPHTFDGQIDVEPNFMTYPEIFSAVPAATGGSLSAGVYQYICTWEWYDAKGQLHQSATSPAISVTTTAATSQVTLTVPQPALTYKRSTLYWSGLSTVGTELIEAFAIIYRTTVNGTLFYRQPQDPPTINNIMRPLTGTNQKSTVVIIDVVGDVQLTAPATAQLLYTTGGQLDNFSPPAARCIVTHRQRWWLAGCDDPTAVWPSQPITPGYVPGFNEQLIQYASGAVRALASLDDKLVAFVRRGQNAGIEYLTGDGPTNTGGSSDWSPFQPIPTAATAVDQRSVVTLPMGVLFMSNLGGPNGVGGLFLLSRDLQVNYLGKPVEAVFLTTPIVTSMVAHTTQGRVYITCVDNDYAPTIGTRLVWDYVQNVWSTDTLGDPDTASTTAPARHACLANMPSGPAMHWVTPAGRAYRETTGLGTNAKTDGGQWVTASFTSAWLKPALSGFGRFWRLQVQSDAVDPANLSCVVTFDYAPASVYNEAHAWTAAKIAAFNRYPQVDIEMIVGNQKAKAIQVALTDSPPTGGPFASSGAGFSWATLTLELGVKPGRYINVPGPQR
jgi:hypothetical protein